MPSFATLLLPIHFTMNRLLGLCLVVALAGHALALRGALFRSGRSDPLIRGMENARAFVTQDFLRFGRSAGFNRFDHEEREDFLPHSRIRALRDPFEYGFIF